MTDREEEDFITPYKEHLKKNVYDVMWYAFLRRDQSNLSQTERTLIFDKFFKALLIMQSITVDTPNTFIKCLEAMDELRVRIETLD